MTRPSANRFFATTAAVLVSMALLSGCGDDDNDNAGAPGAVPSSQPSEQPGISEEQRLRNLLASLRAEMDGLAASRSCNADTDCLNVPLGSKPCGGPDSYFVYSSTQTEPARVEALAQQYTETDRRLDTLIGGVSDCRFVEPPEMECDNGSCRTE